ncbi:uncharacterized protein ARB_03035 [Trichophyton benhamiae CBS 112371]|uniref:Secreted protein n=1 Tax=Arthroderma benhamiae (strain ATCC MYA-4681 / CBS 112371) TaxID=663331 RepID=D4B3J6_ARTBC|nr:uncharacterized protein ARB_03035 [Trichophyton benhamiae CBS 112371]EFE29694.1 hypothetical protein ARB_03035 [Trichophyton benhamiae CBS 112371]
MDGLFSPLLLILPLFSLLSLLSSPSSHILKASLQASPAVSSSHLSSSPIFVASTVPYTHSPDCSTIDSTDIPAARVISF